MSQAKIPATQLDFLRHNVEILTLNTEEFVARLAMLLLQKQIITQSEMEELLKPNEEAEKVGREFDATYEGFRPMFTRT